ncbi:hypothetical protein GCM10027615_41270 [Plantactinospora veratri]
MWCATLPDQLPGLGVPDDDFARLGRRVNPGDEWHRSLPRLVGYGSAGAVGQRGANQVLDGELAEPDRTHLVNLFNG